MRPLGLMLDALDAQRGALFPWLPVCMGFGIGGYFALPFEPGAPALWFCGLCALLCVLGAMRGPARMTPVLAALAMVALGGALAGLRTHSIAAPVLGFRYYGPVEGRIVHVDKSVSDKVRLTLDHVVLFNTPSERTPDRVRVSLHGVQGFVDPKPGIRIAVTAHLGPPEGPVEPGGFDFQRMAWFDALGAVGYARTPAVLAAPALGGDLVMARLRAHISASVQQRMPGEEGAFAAAILTGDRSGMSAETQEALRASNLAHLLAISGLHMGLLTGTVLALFKFVLAALPARWPVPAHKVAAVGALMAAAFYLALSGGNVATERAFIMVAVMLGAVILGRRALTLRAVALAAILILTWRPEVLTEPGFQMSFAATTALVAIFAYLRDREGRKLPKWARGVATLVISSAVAGIATAPVAAAHFNRIADYGLIANLVSVPLMGLVVMPAAVASAVLAPLGLESLGFAVMRPAIAWIIGVAHWVGNLDGALTHVKSPSAWVMPVMSMGGLWLMFWQGRARLAGLAGVALGLILWLATERPEVLISPDGGLVGRMTAEGRALSKPKGSGFAAQSWLENDGDAVDQETAAARAGFQGGQGVIEWQVGATQFAHVSGRGAADKVAGICGRADVVFTTAKVPVSSQCRVITAESLRDTGAVAIFDAGGAARMVTARDTAGVRVWNSARARTAYAQSTDWRRVLAHQLPRLSALASGQHKLALTRAQASDQ